LDGQPVMAMFRRSQKSSSALRRRQQEIEQREAELREKVEKLSRMVINAPQSGGKTSLGPEEKGSTRDGAGDKQLHVSIALEDRNYFDKNESRRRPRSLRKERREGRMVFLLLVAALAAAVIWLMSHLHF
jgi:multidrug resistance efflux pump